MSDDAKYIVFGRNDDYPPTPIVFPTYLQHRDVANAMRGLLGEPSSAGFVSMNALDTAVFAWGESISLGLKSDGPRDSRLLAKILDLDKEN
jgi:hypothetical protein